VLPIVLLAAAAGLLLILPMWRVQAVEVRGGEVVPPSTSVSLEGLSGHLIPLLDLDWLHGVAAVRPEVSDVQVRLDLPGTIVVAIYPEQMRGSMAVGSGWHAVAADGRMAGAIAGPSAPELIGFQRPADRRSAFSVARRIADASGGRVVSLEQVTPADYRLELEIGQPSRAVTVHVDPGGTEAEEVWCELVKNDGAVVWADLRWPHRIVMREAA
jgi:hypothetical protein